MSGGRRWCRSNGGNYNVGINIERGGSMSPEEVERMKRLATIVTPYATERLAKLGRGRVVHYTSAENAYKIISSKQMWLRNTNMMVDYSEVIYGHGMLARFFKQETHRNLFYEAMNLCHAGVGEEATRQFDNWWEVTRHGTYVASISEHDEKEDTTGRLSMWRGFSQNSATRVAIVMNVPEFGAAEGLRLLLNPVAYFGYADVEQQLWDVIARVRANVDFLKTYPQEHFRNILFFMLVSAAVSMKHRGFEEEREWRVIHLPDANPSELVKCAIEIIGGIPQIVYKVPLEENPENDVVGAGLPSLIDRVIIGPTTYRAPLMLTFRKALRDAAVPDAEGKVFQSEIPIRY